MLPLVDRNAGDVGRQQVAGELDAREGQPQQAGQRVGEGGLADAWQILDQQMSAGEQAGQRLTNLAILAEDDATGGGKDRVERSRLRGQARKFGYRHHDIPENVGGSHSNA